MKAEPLFFNFPKNAVPLLKKAALTVLKAKAGKQRGARGRVIARSKAAKQSWCCSKKREIALQTSGESSTSPFGPPAGEAGFAKTADLDKFVSRLNFVLVSDAEIRALNKKYRKVDRVTDIISFRLSKKPLCGDIYVARGRSIKQAAEMKHSWKFELCYLVLHGALHLFDYTDYTPREKKKMFAVQDRLFKQLNSFS